MFRQCLLSYAKHLFAQANLGRVHSRRATAQRPDHLACAVWSIEPGEASATPPRAPGAPPRSPGSLT